MTEPRLLVPTEAAVYLGLRSRWAIYRLVAAGELPAVRLAGKLLLDLRDLDTLIETSKVTAGAAVAHSAARPTVGRPRVLTELAPLRPARNGDRTVTATSKPRVATVLEPGALHIQSGAPARGGTA